MKYRETFAAVCLSALLVTLAFVPASATPEVKKIYHTPEKVTADDDVVVYIEIINSSEVSKAYLGYCQLDPELCHIPIEMKYVGSDTYTCTIGKLKENIKFKYNVTITFKDGNSTVSPTNSFTVEPKGTGGNPNQTQNNTTNPPVPPKPVVPEKKFIPTQGTVAAVSALCAVCAITLLRRNRTNP